MDPVELPLRCGERGRDGQLHGDPPSRGDGERDVNSIERGVLGRVGDSTLKLKRGAERCVPGCTSLDVGCVNIIIALVVDTPMEGIQVRLACSQRREKHTGVEVASESALAGKCRS